MMGEGGPRSPFLGPWDARDGSTQRPKPMRITSTGYPLPGVGSTSLVSRLKYVGAFARVKEEASGDYTITPERDYGISSVFPQESPSPTKVWKSLTASASSNQVLVCDFGAVTRFDEKLPFVVLSLDHV